MYFWVKEQVDTGELKVVLKGTKEMYAKVLTKPLQGAHFVYERVSRTGWPLPKGAKILAQSFKYFSHNFCFVFLHKGCVVVSVLDTPMSCILPGGVHVYVPLVRWY